MHKQWQVDPRYETVSLGGEDIFVDGIRAHLWETQASKDAKSEKTTRSHQTGAHQAGAHRFLILPGFTEFCEKYAHVAHKLVEQGHDCLIIDWPGQGLSGHHGATPLMVHCDKFADHIRALEAVIKAAKWHRGTLHILSHSMGGHLALLACARLSDRIGTVVLAAPMILPRPRPSSVIRLLGLVLGMAGRNRHYPPFTKVPSLSQVEARFNENILTTDRAGYEWQTRWFDTMPELRRSGASVGWVREAYRSAARYVANKDFLEQLTMPMLVLLPEKEQVVSKSKIAFAASHLPNADLVEIKSGKHELFNEQTAIDKIVWDHIFRFWDRQGL